MNTVTKTLVSMIIALAMIGIIGTATVGVAMANSADKYDSSVFLDNKNATYALTPGDGIGVEVLYNAAGDEFEWQVIGTGSPNTWYSLIYYADKPNRTENWGGDNPGALIGKMHSHGSTGVINSFGSTELNMDLPCSPDENMNASDYNYTESDGYVHPNGAKLWLVPSDCLNGYPGLDAWLYNWSYCQPLIMFETDLITYTDTSIMTPPTLTTYTITNTTIVPPQTTSIDVEFSEQMDTISIKIEDASGSLVNQLYTASDIKDPSPKTWDGTYTNGTIVPVGTYTVDVSGVSDETGLSVVDTSKTITVGAAITLTWDVEPPAVVTQGDDVIIDISFSEAPYNYSIRVENITGHVVWTHKVQGNSEANPVAQTWETSAGTTPGDYNIIVNINGVNNSDTRTVEVVEPGTGQLDRVEISPDSVDLHITDTQQFYATCYNTNGDSIVGCTITWSCDNPTIGTIDSTGVFTAVVTGTATVTALGSYGGIQKLDTAIINVTAPPTSEISIGDIIRCDNDFRNVTLPVVVSNANNIGSMQITVSYNKELINVTGVTDGAMDGTDYFIGDGYVNISGYQDENAGMNETFDLANIIFKPIANGECGLEIVNSQCYDATYNTTDINIIVNNGKYSTTATLLGDVNANGDVNVGDVMVLAKHLTGLSGFDVIDECAADVDRNCEIDTNDVMYLVKALLGVPGYTLDPSACVL